MTVSFTLIDIFFLVVGSIASASQFWLFVIGFPIERFYQPTQRMFSFVFLLLSYSVLMMTLATSPLGVLYPVFLVAPSIVSGFIASGFMIYISGVVHPIRPASRFWLLLGIPGITYACTACVINGGLEHLSLYVHYGNTIPHPILTPMFFVHFLSVLLSIFISAYYVFSGFQNRIDRQQRSALLWIMYGIIIAFMMMILGNIAPLIGFPYVLKLVPISTIPIGLLCYRSLKVQAGLFDVDKLDGKAAAEKRLESLGRMARGVSHDINNMLTSVMGSAELIRVKTKTNMHLRVHVEQILNSSTRAAQLMEGMLSFSGRGRVPPPTLPQKLITEAIEAARVQCPNNVILKAELEEDLPWIRVAPQDFVNAILNLILNGIESIEANNGTLSVTAVHLHESIIPESAFGAVLDGHPSLFLTVKDNGSGMDEQTKSHIYEPFFSTKDSGKGLGLMSVFSIVQHYGGAIFCESTLGLGTEFKLWIPVSAPPKITSIKATPSFTQCNLILVEDNCDVRSVIVELLKTMDMNVKDFSSAEEVLSILDETLLKETDLFLLDIRLNGISGVELAHKIRDEEPLARILFMSGDEHEHTMKQFKEEEHIGFMRKPINLDVLGSAISTLGIQK